MRRIPRFLEMPFMCTQIVAVILVLLLVVGDSCATRVINKQLSSKSTDQIYEIHSDGHSSPQHYADGSRSVRQRSDSARESNFSPGRSDSFRLRRDTTAGDSDVHSSEPMSTLFNLNDSHTSAYISWVAYTPYVVALTKTTSFSSQRSKLYVSTNYGRDFVDISKNNISCLCVKSGSATIYANLDGLYHASAKQKEVGVSKNYIFTDAKNNIIVVTKDLVNFTTVKLDFTPSIVYFHPEREDVILAASRDSFGHNSLYFSLDFGFSWTKLRDNVMQFQWGWQPDQLLLSVSKFFGLFGFAGLFDLKEYTFQGFGFVESRTIISNILDFELSGSFLFAAKRYSLFGGNNTHLDLYVSKQDSAFVKAQFPIFRNYKNLDYFIVDTDYDRVLLCVAHGAGSAHLYVSDVSGSKYTLSLPNIVYQSKASTGHSDSVPDMQAYADIFKVDGLDGIYIASQFFSNDSSSNSSQTTRITYDKGGVWTHLDPPYTNFNKTTSLCVWYKGCTLHVLQYYDFNIRHLPPLSSKNAIGLVMATGVYGQEIKVGTAPSTFLSRDGGVTWDEVASGVYSYTFGDHGNLIVMTPLGKYVTELLYSHDEGRNWKTYKFSNVSLIIYGLLTEPGSTSGNFSLWGSESGDHSWVVVHLNLLKIFGDKKCAESDYKPWSPGLKGKSKEICLLGQQRVIWRKNATKFCFNGEEFERLNVTNICKCTREDYECDYGFILANQTDQIWNLQPSLLQNELLACVPDPDITDAIIDSKPANCPYGTKYNITRGYRKIVGDVCYGGESHTYDLIEKSCPVDNKTDFIVYSAGTNIYKLELPDQSSENQEPVILVSAVSNDEIYSVEYDYHRDILFWADHTEDSIKYIDLSDPYATAQVLLSNNTGKVECLSLDWESDNIYFVDSRTPKIEVFTYLTKWRRTIVRNTPQKIILEKPRALDLVPSHGIMFWTDWSDRKPRIMKSTMSGYDPKPIITNTSTLNLVWPNGLAVDIDSERLYAIDGNTHMLFSSRFDGTDLKVLLTDALIIRHPFALAVYKSRVYWSDWQDHKIKSVYKASGDGFYVLTHNDNVRITSMQLMNWDQQYIHNNTGCGDQNSTNGGCSNICVPHQNDSSSANTYRLCLCPENLRFSTESSNKSETTCKCSDNQIFNTITGYCELRGNMTCIDNTYVLCPGSKNACIKPNWICDGENDCKDMSDETNCASVVCGANQMLCKRPQICIDQESLCDGYNDCPDASDETSPVCNKTCRADQFQCANGLCIDIAYKCDHELDCGFADSSDEQNCDYEQEKCSASQFQCDFTWMGPKCVAIGSKCDGVNDCDDGSDERNCTYSCGSDYFRCNNSRCVSKFTVCDGYNDCYDRSDETGCSTTSTIALAPGTSPTNCLCWSYDGRCVTVDAVCDGQIDCPHGEDEYNCRTTNQYWTTTRSACPFFCDNRCIYEYNICDNKTDCRSGEDEKGCTCPRGMIRCAFGRRCIYKSQQCDLIRDCLYGTDEDNCDKGFAKCATTEFTCLSGLCIQNEQVCDGLSDCEDNFDESNCTTQVTLKNLRATSASSNYVTLTWESSSTDSHIQYLILYRAIINTADETSTLLNYPVTVTNRLAYVVPNLIPNSEYTFQVQAQLIDGSRSLPSNVLKVTTQISLPGVVLDLSETYDSTTTVLSVSWRRPAAPNNTVTRFILQVSVADNKQIIYTNPYIWPQGAGNRVHFTAVLSEYSSMIKQGRIMQVQVGAVNAMGYGENVTHTVCTSIPFTQPSLICKDMRESTINLTAILRSPIINYYTLYLSYRDVNGLVRQTSDNGSFIGDIYDNNFFFITDLSPGTFYNFSAYVMSPSTPGCKLASAEVSCLTTGRAIQKVQNLKVLPGYLSSVEISWNPVPDAISYTYLVTTVMHADQNPDELSMSVVDNRVTVQLKNCAVYAIKVKVNSPYPGPWSQEVYYTTPADILSPPENVRVPTYSYDDYSDLPPDVSDMLCIDVLFSLPCPSIIQNYTIIVSDINDSPNKYNKYTSVNMSVPRICVERSGIYLITVKANIPAARNSSILYWAFPYPAPDFLVRFDENSSLITLQFDYNYYFSRRPSINIQYGVNGSEVDLGIMQMPDGSFTIPGPYVGNEYIVRVRYARLFNGKYYYGTFGNRTVHFKNDAVSAKVQSSQSRIALFVGVGVSVLVILVLAILLTTWCVKHRRLQRSFLEFTSSHYNSRTDNATFNDDDDSPMIHGFSDDEPLVVA